MNRFSCGRRLTIALGRSILAMGALVLLGAADAQAQQASKPNIVIFWCDDVGQSNISAYSHGVMCPPIHHSIT